MISDLLERLDDPTPYVADPLLADRARGRGRQLRRRRRLGALAVGLPAVLVLTLLAGAVWVERRTDQVARVEMGSGALAPVAPGAAFDVLVVGTDAPSPLDGSGPVGVRSDTIMVVHVDRTAGTVRVLSLPRDLVPAGATSGGDRLNERITDGGPEALVRAVHDQLGIDIAHYVGVDFQGFERLVNATGPISVRATTPIRDVNTGLELDTTCRRLDGGQALALTRSRHVEYLDATGHWVSDPTGDLGRVARQQVVLSLMFDGLTRLPDDPATFDQLLTVFADNTTIDAGFGRATILDLIRWGHGLSRDAISMTTLPTQPTALPDGAEVLRPAAGAETAVAAFEGRTTPPLPAGPAVPAAPFSVEGCS